MTDPRYPIGRYEYPASVSAEERERFIRRLETAPEELRASVAGLTAEQLDTPYREGGWTVRQVVHHLPDSHMNSYIRFKLALTEDEPLIKPYDEAAWAVLEDSARTPIETSLQLFESLHGRWTVLLRGLTDDQWSRKMRHPEWLHVDNGRLQLDRVVALYAWHCNHHIAHIRQAAARG